MAEIALSIMAARKETVEDANRLMVRTASTSRRSFVLKMSPGSRKTVLIPDK